MRAHVLHNYGLDGMTLTDVPEPEVGPGEVTIRDMASGDQNRVPLAQAGADLRERLER